MWIAPTSSTSAPPFVHFTTAVCNSVAASLSSTRMNCGASVTTAVASGSARRAASRQEATKRKRFFIGRESYAGKRHRKAASSYNDGRFFEQPQGETAFQ